MLAKMSRQNSEEAGVLRTKKEKKSRKNASLLPNERVFLLSTC